MSLIERLEEEKRHNRELVAAIKTVLKMEILRHETSVGVAKKIISEGDTKSLSQNQEKIFKMYILPTLRPNCDNPDCSNQIEICDLPEAVFNEFEEGGLFCEECLHMKSKIRWLEKKT